MRKISCTGGWKVRGPRTAETGCTVLGRFHPGAGCTAPKTQRTKEIVPDKAEKYSGAWATETKCAVICRPLPGAGCTAPRVRDHMAEDCQYKLQIGPLERRVVMGATGPKSRDGMHRTLSQATGTVETTYPIKSEDVPMTKVLGGSGSERGDGMHRALPLAARKVEAEKKKREHERDTRERLRKGMLKELDDRLESIGKLEVEESGKVLEQCKWTDIY